MIETIIQGWNPPRKQSLGDITGKIQYGGGRTTSKKAMKEEYGPARPISEWNPPQASPEDVI